MKYDVLDFSPFNGKIYKIESNSITYFIGIANYKEGCGIFFPQAGSDYTLIMFNNNIYRFLSTEFSNPCSVPYLQEKLKCSEKEAQLVFDFVQDILIKDAANKLLIDKVDYKNPFTMKSQ